MSKIPVNAHVNKHAYDEGGQFSPDGPSAARPSPWPALWTELQSRRACRRRTQHPESGTAGKSAGNGSSQP